MTDDPIDENEYFELNGKKYCSKCASTCIECGAVLLTGGHHEFSDVYDPGYPFPHPDNPFYGSVCLDCYDELTQEEEE
jgi:hypothetical protein